MDNPDVRTESRHAERYETASRPGRAPVRAAEQRDALTPVAGLGRGGRARGRGRAGEGPGHVAASHQAPSASTPPGRGGHLPPRGGERLLFPRPGSRPRHPAPVRARVTAGLTLRRVLAIRPPRWPRTPGRG